MPTKRTRQSRSRKRSATDGIPLPTWMRVAIWRLQEAWRRQGPTTPTAASIFRLILSRKRTRRENMRSGYLTRFPMEPLGIISIFPRLRLVNCSRRFPGWLPIGLNRQRKMAGWILISDARLLGRKAIVGGLIPLWPEFFYHWLPVWDISACSRLSLADCWMSRLMRSGPDLTIIRFPALRKVYPCGGMFILETSSRTRTTKFPRAGGFADLITTPNR